MKKAYLGIKYYSDHRNKGKIDFISSIVEKFGYSTTCITRDVEKWGKVQFSPNDLMFETFKIIESSDIVIIDLSEKGVGLGIEAGYAYSKQIPIITISEKQKISTTLLGISRNHFVYEEESDLFDFLNHVLKEIFITSTCSRTALAVFLCLLCPTLIHLLLCDSRLVYL